MRKLLSSAKFKKFFATYFVFQTFLLLALPALAQTTQITPSQNTTQTQNIAPNTSPDPTTTSTPPKNQLSENIGCKAIGFFGFGDPCNIKSGVQDAVSDGISGLAESIMGFFREKMIDLITEVVGAGLSFVAKLLNFDACDLVPGWADQFGWCDSAFLKSPSTFSAFSYLDLGMSGVFQTIPYQSPPQYFAKEFQNNVLGIGSANAQGIGTDSLDAIRGVWAKIENICLVLMALVMLVISFMIMIRRRLPDKSVLTALNALPRIAVSLILIVFSFAISGLFIDFIYIADNVVRNYFSEGVVQGFFGFLSNKLGGELIWLPFFTAFSFGSIIDYHQLWFKTGGGLLVGSLLFGIFTVIFETIVRFILFAVCFWIFWKLIETFAKLIAYTIFSPIFFLVGAIPGYESVIMDWFKRMAAAVLVFPAVIIFLHLGLGMMFLSNPVTRFFTGSSVIQAPPPIGSSVVNIPYLLGIGFLFFASKIPSFFEELFGAKGGGRGGLSPGSLILAPINTTTSLFSRERGSAGAAVQGTYLPMSATLAKSPLGKIPYAGALFRAPNNVLAAVNRFTSGARGADEAATKKTPAPATNATGTTGTHIPDVPRDDDVGGGGRGVTPPPGGGGGGRGGGDTSGGGAGGRSSGADTSGLDKLGSAAERAAGKLDRIPGAPGRPLKHDEPDSGTE